VKNTNNTTYLINTLTESMDKISKTKNNFEINNILDKLLIDFTQSEFATILIYNSDKQLLYTENETSNINISMINPKGLLGNAYLSKKTGIYNHIASEKYYIPSIDNPKDNKIKSQIIMPILDNDNLISIVRVSRSIKYPNKYTRNDLDLLTSLMPFFKKIIYILKDKKYNNIKFNDSQIQEEIIKIENKEINNSEDMLFISNIIHDIRTPANSLYGFLELLENKIDDKRLNEYIQNAKESAEFINILTDSILDKTRDKFNNELENNFQEVNTIKFFSNIANSFSANMSSKNITYLIFLDPSLPKRIVIDKIKLKRIIINLIANAYKFTPTGKKIKFKVLFNKEKQKIAISIKDDGIGIAEEQQKNIFESFKQAEADTKEKYGGSGLGLAISAQYVKDMGGRLLLKSQIDKGSEFYFNINIKVLDDKILGEEFKISDNKITILSDKKSDLNILLIMKYLTKLGISKQNIIVSHTLCTDTTHLICFEHKLNSAIMEITQTQDIKLLVLEESLFNLDIDKDIDIISMNTYYGDRINCFISTKKMTKILLADDNKINISLLKAILEDEYCELTITTDGKETLEKLKYAHINGRPFDMIFLDNYMPSLSGSEVIKEVRLLEKKKQLKPIYAISITGDPFLSDKDKKLFNLHVTKPFKNRDVKNAFKLGSQ